ncbi:MAG: ATP-binding protein [Lachnospirales bacterium]
MVIISSNTGLKWYQSVRTKLLITLLVVSIVPMVFFIFNIRHTLRVHFEDQNKKEALYTANKIAGSIQTSGYLHDFSKQKQFWADLVEKGEEENCRIIVVNKNAYVLADTNEIAVGKMYIVPEILTALDGTDGAYLRDDEDSIYASAYIENEKSEKIGAVLVVSSFSDVSSFLSEINSKWITITLIIAVIVIILSVTFAKFILEPLKKILDTVNKISEGHLNQRIELKGNNEYTKLSDSINTMTQSLEQVEQSRQEFVSNVSHELKTPLSSIKVLSDSLLLQEDVPNEMYREFMQDINSEVDRMTNIINDLLSLVRLDGGAAKLNITSFNANEFLKDIIKQLTPLANKKNITINFEAGSEVRLEADEVKLNLAISNLVENGIKYTPEDGSVKISLESDNQFCFITVQDTGIGISEEEQSKVFERFYRVDNSRDRETGGTGLGLAITHSTIMLHSGSVKIISGEGKGATFIVKIPLKAMQN